MAVRIHHLNCGLFHDKFQKIVHREHFCCHCLLIEGPQSLALIDTGLPAHYSGIFDELYHQKILNVKEIEKYNSVAQLKALGFSPKDVRDIFITHLDHDHVGGLADFPEARVHLHLNEYEFSKKIASSLKLKLRFKTHLWKNAQLQFYSDPGETWNGFSSVKNTIAFQDDLMIIPLFGHTPGHTGYAVKENEQWVFHAGDAFYFKEDLNDKVSEQSLPGELIARLTAIHNEERIANLKKLRHLNAENKNVLIINSHDDQYLP